MDDVECPECGNKSDIERVGFHDVGSRRRKVLACNGCGHVYTRPAGRGDIGVMKDLYQHLTTAALQPIPDGWVMMPSSMIDDELEVVVFHAGGVVMDEFDGLGVGYEVEEIRGCDWVWKLAAV